MYVCTRVCGHPCTCAHHHRPLFNTGPTHAPDCINVVQTLYAFTPQLGQGRHALHCPTKPPGIHTHKTHKNTQTHMQTPPWPGAPTCVITTPHHILVYTSTDAHTQTHTCKHPPGQQLHALQPQKVLQAGHELMHVQRLRLWPGLANATQPKVRDVEEQGQDARPNMLRPARTAVEM